MLTKHITIKNRVATYTQRDGEIICDNSDFKIIFTFDSEWETKLTRYARFIWNGMYQDVQFTGNECKSPFIQNADFLEVGVCTGDPENATPEDFWSTTAARIPCRTSVLDITDQAQEGRVKQMRDAAIQAAEDAKESAKTAAECAKRAEGATTDVGLATSAAERAAASAESASASAGSASSAAERASSSAGSAASSAAEATAAVNTVDSAFDQVNGLLELLINGGA